MNLEYRFSPQVKIFLDLRYRDKDYLEDFEDRILKDSLDYQDYRAIPGIWFRPGKGFTLVVTGEFRLKEYQERFPRARDGTPVFPFFPPGASEKPFEPREYTYRGINLQWEWELTDRWEVEGEYKFTDRKDEFLGYMDYQSQDVDLNFRGKFGKRFTLTFNTSYKVLDYEGARVFFKEVNKFGEMNEIKRAEKFFFGSRLTYRIKDATRLFFFYRFKDRDDRTPIFDYTQNQVGAGVLLILKK